MLGYLQGCTIYDADLLHARYGERPACNRTLKALQGRRLLLSVPHLVAVAACLQKHFGHRMQDPKLGKLLSRA